MFAILVSSVSKNFHHHFSLAQTSIPVDVSIENVWKETTVVKLNFFRPFSAKILNAKVNLVISNFLVVLPSRFITFPHLYLPFLAHHARNDLFRKIVCEQCRSKGVSKVEGVFASIGNPLNVGNHWAYCENSLTGGGWKIRKQRSNLQFLAQSS